MDSIVANAGIPGFVYVVAGLLAFLAAVFLFRNLIWAVRYPFLFLNWLQWQLYNPIRDSWKDPRSSVPALVFGILFYSGVGPLYWLAVHIALTPIRIVNSLYFDIVLYWSVVFCDSIFEFVHPRLSYRYRGRRMNYLTAWLWFSPIRFWNIFKRNGLALLEGILMCGVDIVFPTYTMYHGTSFKGIATNIAQRGRWYVGGGDYAGSGVYFGLYRNTAEHYSKGEDHALICARVTLFPCRNSATLERALRKKIGSDGCGISSGLPFIWKSIEHWRDHSYAQWFEYCLIQPGKSGQYIHTWRARPICVLKHAIPKRIWGGLSLWVGGAGGLRVILFSWSIIALIGYLVIYYLPM